MNSRDGGVVTAPWDDRTVRNLNRFQRLSWVHPYTCGYVGHATAIRLCATSAGWRCADPHEEGCEYTQNWASAVMANPDRWPPGPTFGPQGVTSTVLWCCNGNAEECTLCDLDKLSYPWICRGDHEETPVNRRTVLVDATTQGRDALKAAMRRFRVHDQAREAEKTETAENSVCELPHETIAEEEACDESVGATSAIQGWADETDLAYALGSFSDGYRHAQRDAQVALELDRITAREAAEWAETKERAEAGEHTYLSTGCLHSNHAYCRGETGAVGVKVPASCKFCAAPCICDCHVDDAADLDLTTLRAHVSRRLLAVAVKRTEREWICCDPVDPAHQLCVQGAATRDMLTALLTDDETAFPSTSDVLDEVMRLIQGIGESGRDGSVLSEASVRELYTKGLLNGYKAVNGGIGSETLHALVTAVMETRDRELARNRHRLGAADEAHRLALLAEMPPAVDAAALEARVRRQARLEILDEIGAKLAAECESPMDEIAFHNLRVWLRQARRETRAVGLDRRSKR